MDFWAFITGVLNWLIRTGVYAIIAVFVVRLGVQLALEDYFDDKILGEEEDDAD